MKNYITLVSILALGVYIGTLRGERKAEQALMLLYMDSVDNLQTVRKRRSPYSGYRS